MTDTQTKTLFYVVPPSRNKLHIHIDAVGGFPDNRLVACNKRYRAIWQPSNKELVDLEVCERCQSILETRETT